MADSHHLGGGRSVPISCGGDRFLVWKNVMRNPLRKKMGERALFLVFFVNALTGVRL